MDCLGLVCMPMGLPWPWLRVYRVALALVTCPFEAALALAAACTGLGCMPLGGCMPWPCLPCPQILTDFPKNEGFFFGKGGYLT